MTAAPLEPTVSILADLAYNTLPTPIIDIMSSTDHFVQFYEADSVIVRSVAEWLVEGLAAGETCIVVATAAHASKMEKTAAELGADIGTAWKTGRYILEDAEGMLTRFMVGDSPDEALFGQAISSLVREAVGRGPVRIFGEMVAVLAAAGNRSAALALEDLWNKLLDECRFSLFCAYPIRDFDSADSGPFMSGVCCGHSSVIPCESYTSLNTSDERLRAVAFLQQRGRQLEAEIAELESRIAAKKALATDFV